MSTELLCGDIEANPGPTAPSPNNNNNDTDTTDRQPQSQHVRAQQEDKYSYSCATDEAGLTRAQFTVFTRDKGQSRGAEGGGNSDNANGGDNNRQNKNGRNGVHEQRTDSGGAEDDSNFSDSGFDNRAQGNDYVDHSNRAVGPVQAMVLTVAAAKTEMAAATVVDTVVLGAGATTGGANRAALLGRPCLASVVVQAVAPDVACWQGGGRTTRATRGDDMAAGPHKMAILRLVQAGA
nr:hypothetical protein BaRGS_010104 [Batillaria attramentaria]